jgi:hypothetical protein
VKPDVPYLGHIADSIEAIESYVACGRESFLQERLIQDADKVASCVREIIAPAGKLG